MSGIETTQLILPLLALVLGPVTSSILSVLKYIFTPIDKLSPMAKQAVLIVLSYLVFKLSMLLGLGTPLPGDPTTWTGETINTILTSLLSLGYYNLRNSVKKPTVV